VPTAPSAETTSAAAALSPAHEPAAAAASWGSAGAAETVITASHFLPHPQLPHSRFSELGKAMGCCQLQLQLDQVGRVSVRCCYACVC
jgi:hypothetical protein